MTLNTGRLATIYHSTSEYGSDRWSAPTNTWIADEEVLRGVAWIPCQDCGATGHFPVPWRSPQYHTDGMNIGPHHEPEPGDDFCIRCKGTGLVPCMV